MTSDKTSFDPIILAALQNLAKSTKTEINNEELQAIAPAIIALLERPINPNRRDLEETEPAFVLQINKT